MARARRETVRLAEFNPLNLANTARPFATLGVRPEDLLSAIVGRTWVRLVEFHPQDLATMPRAFTTRHVRHAE